MAYKIYLPQTVVEAAEDRVRWLFGQFEEVVVSYSGGKDSDVTLAITLKVAEELGRLPVNVMFLDQEVEWQCTIDHVRRVFSDPRVKPYWLQVPFRLFNAASSEEEWLNCWDPEREEDWMRPKETDSIHENVFGTDRFKEMFDGFGRWLSPDKPLVNLGGVRCEESPGRLRGLTSYETFKGETWGKKRPGRVGEPDHFVFYPLYDWSYTDIWKYLHENEIPYCRYYDYAYQYGEIPKNMRVSSLTHETAVKTLKNVQEIERDTWVKATKRLRGINSVKHMKESLVCPKELPSMFGSWREYRDYLLKSLIAEEHQPKLRTQIKRLDTNFRPEAQEKICKAVINAILVNDYHGTKIDNVRSSIGHLSWNHGKRRREEEAAGVIGGKRHQRSPQEASE